jgi:hypothetical protein
MPVRSASAPRSTSRKCGNVIKSLVRVLATVEATHFSDLPPMVGLCTNFANVLGEPLPILKVRRAFEQECLATKLDSYSRP